MNFQKLCAFLEKEGSYPGKLKGLTPLEEQQTRRSVADFLTSSCGVIVTQTQSNNPRVLTWQELQELEKRLSGQFVPEVLEVLPGLVEGLLQEAGLSRFLKKDVFQDLKLRTISLLANHLLRLELCAVPSEVLLSWLGGSSENPSCDGKNAATGERSGTATCATAQAGVVPAPAKHNSTNPDISRGFWSMTGISRHVLRPDLYPENGGDRT